MHTKFWSENLKGKRRLGYLHVDNDLAGGGGKKERKDLENEREGEEKRK